MASCAPVGNRRLAADLQGFQRVINPLPICPTTSAEFPFVGKLSGISFRLPTHFFLGFYLSRNQSNATIETPNKVSPRPQ